MKKYLFVIFLVAVGVVFASCKSAASQEEVNQSFRGVYQNYNDSVNLEGAKVYEVKQGDTLSDIAKAFYGNINGYYFPLIMLASNNVVLDPDFIEPGMKLTIPDFDKNIKVEEQAAKIGYYFKDIADVYKLKTTKNAADIRENLIKISSQLGK